MPTTFCWVETDPYGGKREVPACSHMLLPIISVAAGSVATRGTFFPPGQKRKDSFFPLFIHCEKLLTLRVAFVNKVTWVWRNPL